jgi:hypothetical protein
MFLASIWGILPAGTRENSEIRMWDAAVLNGYVVNGFGT